MQEIICVLDISGSMQAVKEDAVIGFNQFLVEQQSVGDANLTVIFFDQSFKVEFEGNIKEMKPLEYWPYGDTTALTDAIGKSFAHVKNRFSREKPEKVIMAILTDGEENSSMEFSKEMVSDLIKEHQEKYAWDVIFLAADQDAWKTAQSYSIKKSNTVNYSSNNTVGGFNSYSSSVLRSRGF